MIILVFKRLFIKVSTLNLQLNVVSVIVHCYQGFGKEVMKAVKIHPDTFVQAALQLVYYRLHEKVAPTYETATMRPYYRGRTETVRSCNMDMVDLCKGWFDKNSSVSSFVPNKSFSVNKND